MANAQTPRQAELQALSLKHSFGFCTNVSDSVHNLSDARRNAFFFVSGHIGVIYDADTHTQTQLLGHSNAISCCVVSADRAYIVTADVGAQDGDGADASAAEEPLVIIWNAHTATPIRTLSLPSGACALDLSADASLLAITTNAQQLYIYHWSATTDTPLAQHTIPCADAQNCVRFHPTDPALLVSNGQTTVIFWHLFPSLFPYIPPLTSKDFRHPVGKFTQSVFLPSLTAPSPISPSAPRPESVRTSAASATMDGDVVVWDIPAFDATIASGDVDWAVKAIKALQLHQGPISVLTCSTDHIVTGGEEGFVRFYDSQFRILAWFEDLGAGPITSLSFSRVPPDPYDQSEFKDADFIAATKAGVVVQVQPGSWEDTNIEKRRGKVMLQYHDGDVYGIAAHPAQALFVITGHSGLLQLWSYDAQELRVSRRFDKLMGHRVAFDPTGEYIAVGFTNGTLRVVYADDLHDVAQSAHRQSRDCITDIIFSHDGEYLATSDADRCVALYKFTPSDEISSWSYIGKYRAHTKPITSVIFGVGENDTPRLLSISEDRTLVEFDVAASSVVNGLVLKNITKIEQVAVPTAMTWHPKMGKEDLLIVASDQYKFKLYNSNTKTCRKTVLGPTYGGPVNQLVAIPSSSSPSRLPSRSPSRSSHASPASSTPTTPSSSSSSRYLAYGTHEKIMGLIKLPLDGNPHRTMGLIAHPGEIASLCASHDAQYLFSAGGADGTVFMWRMDLRALDALADAGGAGVAPYSQALERERGGEEKSKEFWAEMHDYFYFAQLKSQGEDTMRPRHIGPTVPLSQVPHILRGLGYYPTEREVEDLVNELKFSTFVDTGEQIEEVTLDTIIKAYANHKPVFGVSEGHLQEAFDVLGANENGELNLEYLLLQLQYKGETMSESEIKDCMRTLLGEDAQSKLAQLKELTAREFAENILGFDPVNL